MSFSKRVGRVVSGAIRYLVIAVVVLVLLLTWADSGLEVDFGLMVVLAGLLASPRVFWFFSRDAFRSRRRAAADPAPRPTEKHETAE